jgi:hypothetical protein
MTVDNLKEDKLEEVIDNLFIGVKGTSFDDTCCTILQQFHHFEEKYNFPSGLENIHFIEWVLDGGSCLDLERFEPFEVWRTVYSEDCSISYASAQIALVQEIFRVITLNGFMK